ncbi:MATE family efflux transporter [Rubrivirga sp. IMCC43871]|uniref:MATE family efflux transporter n=1 Tax=Rubrivirga sp. IMCC43871 TaxID=3391575 RepID=UPI00398FEC43
MPDPSASSAPSPSGVRGLLRDLRAAVRGTDRDYTSGPIGTALLLLAVPMVLEMVMESVFAVVDVYWVASLGAPAVAAVGLTESVLSLMYAVAMGLSMAATAVVARRIGEKDREGAARAAVQAIAVAVVASVPFAVVGVFYSDGLLALMGADPETAAVGAGYMAWMLGGNAVIMLLFVFNAVFRGAGDAAIAMRVLWLANGINLVLDPVLIFGWGPFPELGVTGAAIATTTGRGIAVLVQVALLLRGGEHIRVLTRHLRLHADVMWRIVRTSAGGIAQFAVATVSWVFLVRLVAEFGAESLAGYTIAIRIFLFTLLPAWGLSNAAATLVGQNLGAGKPGRAERSIWIAGVVTMVLLGLVSIGYVVYDEALVRLFTADPEVIATGALCLRVLAYGYVLFAWAMILPQAFNGAGDTLTPTWINLGCFWLLQAPVAWALAFPLGLGELGVYVAITVANVAAAIVGWVLFRRGRWKLTTL